MKAKEKASIKGSESTEEAKTEAAAGAQVIHWGAGGPCYSISSWNRNQSTDRQPGVINTGIAIFSLVFKVT